MRILNNILTLGMVLFTLGLSAQDNSKEKAETSQDSLKEKPTEKVIAFSEQDQDGNNHPNNEANKIIDINSVLTINIDKKRLLVNAHKTGKGEITEEYATKISQLLLVLKDRKESLAQLDRIINKYDYLKFKSDTLARKDFNAELQKATEKLLDIRKIDKRIRREAMLLSSQEPGNEYAGEYLAAEKVLGMITTELEEHSNQNGVKIQFGSWLVARGLNTSIHLNGFDSIAPPKPYEVERWQLLPTEKQIEELKNIQQIAKDNKGKEDQILNNMARNQIAQLSDFVNSKIEVFENKIKAEIVKIKASGDVINSQLNSIITDVETLEVLLKNFSREIKDKIEANKTLITNTPINYQTFLSNITTDITFVKEEGQKIVDEITRIYKKITDLSSSTVQELKVLFEKAETDYKTSLEALTSLVTDKVQEILYGIPLDEASLEFSEAVFKLSISDLPTSTILDLVDTGLRKDGDRLAFKLEVTDNKGKLYAENRDFYMFQVLPHVKGTVGVIFADPLTRTAVKTNFQMAPYYNMIIKGLFDKKVRRRSIVYNRLLDWGVGLHVSAPDFDGDDVPELGAGIVFSLLHDYIQSGAAINVFTGDPYWFFGVRLPVPSLNIGSGSTASDSN